MRERYHEHRCHFYKCKLIEDRADPNAKSMNEWNLKYAQSYFFCDRPKYDSTPSKSCLLTHGSAPMNITRRKHSRNCAVLVCYQRGCPDQKIAQNKAMYLKISISPFNRLHMNPFKCIITSCKVYPLLSLSFGYCFQRRFASLFPSFPSSLSFFFSSNKYGIFALDGKGAIFVVWL